ncbi:hypothetical protein Tco_1179211, partial [Tanacetum coccineum]
MLRLMKIGRQPSIKEIIILLTPSSVENSRKQIFKKRNEKKAKSKQNQARNGKDKAK